MADTFDITKQWVLAGHAIFTVHNGDTHYTYKVDAKELPAKGQWPAKTMYFVSLLTGPDNQDDFTYLGCLDPESGELFATGKSRWKAALAEYRRLRGQRKYAEAKAYAEAHIPLPVRVLRWALPQVVWPGAEVPEGYGIHGEGRCGRCGRPLTRPEGVDPAGYRFGYGPTCWGKMNGAA